MQANIAHKSNMRILINVPDLYRPGGVSGLFNILKMEEYYTNISHFVVHNKMPFLFRLIIKYISFSFKLFNIEVVHINPSLDRNSFLRDAVFAWITLIFSKKLIVYWHGWQDSYEEKIKNSILLRNIAQCTFLKAHSTVVLGTQFERKLRAMGYKNKVYIETNTAESKYIKLKIPKTIIKDQQIILLFLSRLEIEKGIYIAIETLKLLNNKTERFKLIVAGSGSEEENIKLLASLNNSIEWAGYVNGIHKHNLLMSAHIMFFPSFFPEGLPLTLLEGMMYGLPIVTNPIGGIPDIIKDGENGYLTKSLSPVENAMRINEVIGDPVLYKTMSQNNLNKSKLFEPNEVRLRIYSYYTHAFYGE